MRHQQQSWKKTHIPIENYTNNLWNETVIRDWKCGLNDMRHVLLICCRERAPALLSAQQEKKKKEKKSIPWHIRFASVCRTRVKSIGCAQISKSLRLDTTLSVIVIIHQTHSDFPLRLMRDQLNKNIIAQALQRTTFIEFQQTTSIFYARCVGRSEHSQVRICCYEIPGICTILWKQFVLNQCKSTESSVFQELSKVTSQKSIIKTNAEQWTVNQSTVRRCLLW